MTTATAQTASRSRNGEDGLDRDDAHSDQEHRRPHERRQRVAQRAPLQAPLPQARGRKEGGEVEDVDGFLGRPTSRSSSGVSPESIPGTIR